MSDFYVGKRLSYDGNLCTVRYTGHVLSTKGTWLGVEWDDATRGKHSGTHSGVKYFECKSKHPNAGSFVRPNRPSDNPLNVNDAIRKKYASNLDTSSEGAPIHISGKEVEEVGFEKIRQQLADFQALRIVVLDQLCISSSAAIFELCPNIQELDLSRNLLENITSVYEIAAQLPQLATLKIDGNRFQPIPDSTTVSSTLSGVTVSFLDLDDTLLSWEEIVSIASNFPALRSLSAGGNYLDLLTGCSLPASIEEVRMEGNQFTSLENIRALLGLKSLRKLALKNNSISDLFTTAEINTSIEDIDLSRNEISSWKIIDRIGSIFLSLTTLRVSHNPLYRSTTEDVDFLETVARLGNLTTLNYSQILPKDRRSAETFYLSKIASELSAVSVSEEANVISRHPRYNDLCRKYGDPVIKRADLPAVHPESLEAGLIRCVLHLDEAVTSGNNDESKVVEKEIPRRFTITNVLGLIGNIFKIEQPGLLELVSDDMVLKPATRPLGMFVDGSSVKVLVRWDKERMKQYMQCKERIARQNQPLHV